LSANTLTICTSPGVRICFWETLRFNLFWSNTIRCQPTSTSIILGQQPKEYRRNSYSNGLQGNSNENKVILIARPSGRGL